MTQCIAIVAIVAMFLAFLSLGTSAGKDPETTLSREPAEVILQIDPPPRVIYVTPPALPDRNPHR